MNYYIVTNNSSFQLTKPWWLVRSKEMIPHKEGKVIIGIDGYSHLEYLYSYEKRKKIYVQWTIGRYQNALITSHFSNEIETINFLKSIIQPSNLNKVFYPWRKTQRFSEKKFELFCNAICENI